MVEDPIVPEQVHVEEAEREPTRPPASRRSSSKKRVTFDEESLETVSLLRGRMGGSTYLVRNFTRAQQNDLILRSYESKTYTDLDSDSSLRRGYESLRTVHDVFVTPPTRRTSPSGRASSAGGISSSRSLTSTTVVPLLMAHNTPDPYTSSHSSISSSGAYSRVTARPPLETSYRSGDAPWNEKVGTSTLSAGSTTNHSQTLGTRSSFNNRPLSASIDGRTPPFSEQLLKNRPAAAQFTAAKRRSEQYFAPSRVRKAPQFDATSGGIKTTRSASVSTTTAPSVSRASLLHTRALSAKVTGGEGQRSIASVVNSRPTTATNAGLLRYVYTRSTSGHALAVSSPSPTRAPPASHEGSRILDGMVRSGSIDVGSSSSHVLSSSHRGARQAFISSSSAQPASRSSRLSSANPSSSLATSSSVRPYQRSASFGSVGEGATTLRSLSHNSVYTPKTSQFSKRAGSAMAAFDRLAAAAAGGSNAASNAYITSTLFKRQSRDRRGQSVSAGKHGVRTLGALPSDNMARLLNNADPDIQPFAFHSDPEEGTIIAISHGGVLIDTDMNSNLTPTSFDKWKQQHLTHRSGSGHGNFRVESDASVSQPSNVNVSELDPSMRIISLKEKSKAKQTNRGLTSVLEDVERSDLEQNKKLKKGVRNYRDSPPLRNYDRPEEVVRADEQSDVEENHPLTEDDRVETIKDGQVLQRTDESDKVDDDDSNLGGDNLNDPEVTLLRPKPPVTGRQGHIAVVRPFLFESSKKHGVTRDPHPNSDEALKSSSTLSTPSKSTYEETNAT